MGNRSISHNALRMSKGAKLSKINCNNVKIIVKKGTGMRHFKNIEDMVNGLVELYDETCSNIILYGSAALNELNYHEINGNYFFYSDIEFIVVPKKKQNEYSKEFRKYLMNLSDTYLKQYSELEQIPYVDVFPVGMDFFKNADIRISTYELKMGGKELKGENVLELLPAVKSDNYFCQIQHIEIVKALKILVLNSYKWFFEKRIYSNEEKKQFCYFLCSSFLNILRTLLPEFGIFEVSLKKRVSALNQIKRDERLTNYFDNFIIAQFGIVEKEKSSCEFIHTPEELFSITYQGYKSMLRFMINCSDEKWMEKLNEQKTNVFAGEEGKIDLLIKLTNFFVYSLECIQKYIQDNKLILSDVEKLVDCFEILLDGENEYMVWAVLNTYKELEKSKWKIIGSKD